MRRVYLLIGLAIPAFTAGFLTAFAVPVAGKFSVCNKTAHPASVALGRFNGKEWGSVGWWTVLPGDCAALLNEPLISRYYYLYAEQGVVGAWDGDRSFCVDKRNFTFESRGNCLARGFETRRFFQVDTGDSPEWTENLAD